NIDQQARDDRTVHLNFNAVLAMADQVRAAKQLLKKPKKDLNNPSLRVEQRNDLRRNVQQVCGDSQDAVTRASCRARLRFSATGVRRAFDTDEANLMVGTIARLARFSD